ncbi:energy-coupling factor ABC transporter ATP-binding protein [Thermococcus sp.]
MIEVRNLYYAYKGEQYVLKGINFSMGEEIVALVGPNGSGKSTFAKHLNGLLKPTRGDVIIDGEDTRDRTVAELSRKVGYVFQNPEHMFFEESVFKEVAFGPKNLGKSEEEIEELVSWALKSVGLEGYEKRAPYSLSGGEKQRLAIACVLSMKPKYLVLDEPTTGLDAKAEKSVVKTIKELKKNGHGILLITHDMDLVLELAERVVLFYKGEKLYDGSVKEFFEISLEEYSLETPELLKLARKFNVGFVKSLDELMVAVSGDGT